MFSMQENCTRLLYLFNNISLYEKNNRKECIAGMKRKKKLEDGLINFAWDIFDEKREKEM